MGQKIKNISAIEIIDSRGYPTLEAKVVLENNITAICSVPSGASTGKLEACELRDNDQKRYLGKGVLKAVKNVNEIIAKKLIGCEFDNYQELDEILIKLDDTPNKSNLGANAILAVSLAFAKALANANNQQFFEFLGNENSLTLPVPMMNIINGGKHADNPIDIQEFMIAPLSANSIKDGIRMGAEVFHNLKNLLKKNLLNTNVGDEGGFAPQLRSANEALDFLCQAIEKSGYKLGQDFMLALDCASSEFYQNGFYEIKSEGKKLNSSQMVEYYQDLIKNYPIYSIEDGCAEDDHEGWQELTKILGKKIQLVGDDLFVTNPNILQDGIFKKMANAILIKLNQIGTLSETIATINIAKNANYSNIVSHRSGETEDTSIAHLAVATNAGQIKTGSLCRTDRTAKYNELIRIEEYLGSRAKYAGRKILKI